MTTRQRALKNSMLFALITLASTAAFAQAGVNPANNSNAGLVAVGSGIAIGLAVLGGTLGQGKAAAAALEGIARNPAAGDKLFMPLILSLALIESLVILAFLVSFIKIPAASFGF